jgi:uracil-DNA glycosylase
MKSAMLTPAISASALGWYLDAGVDEALLDAPQNRTRPIAAFALPEKEDQRGITDLTGELRAEPLSAGEKGRMALIPKSDLYEQAVSLARAASTLDELRAAVEGFEGIALKKTATNLVFAEGNPLAPIMLVGEAPGADEDRLGFPFVGVSGQLLDKILRCIDLDRKAQDPAKAVYISNILNWRPPGNRTPAPAEVELSLPFIERHIQLVKPRLLILCGGVSAKALLGTEESVSKLRRRWHDYTPLTPALREGAEPIPAIATYHPSYLLRTPSQKKAVWADMLTINQKRKQAGF